MAINGLQVYFWIKPANPQCILWQIYQDRSRKPKDIYYTLTFVLFTPRSAWLAGALRLVRAEGDISFRSGCFAVVPQNQRGVGENPDTLKLVREFSSWKEKLLFETADRDRIFSTHRRVIRKIVRNFCRKEIRFFEEFHRYVQQRSSCKVEFKLR